VCSDQQTDRPTDQATNQPNKTTSQPTKEINHPTKPNQTSPTNQPTNETDKTNQTNQPTNQNKTTNLPASYLIKQPTQQLKLLSSETRNITEQSS